MAGRKVPARLLVMAALVLFVFLFVFFLYTFLHEGGHAIAGLLFGQSLTEFDVSFWDMSAHVGMNGGDLTRAQQAVRSVAGASLPLFIWAVFISIVPRKATFTVEALKLLSSMAVVNTLLPWIVLPVLFLFGKAPSDDVTHFLRDSRMPPLLLSVIALALYAGGWMLFLSKIDGLREELRLFNTTAPEKLLEGAGRIVPLMAGLMSVCAAITLALNGFAGRTLDPFSPPSGFDPVAQVDLSVQPYSGESLAEVTLTDPALIGVFIAVQDIDTSYFDLSATGADGFRSTILHGEGYRADRDGGLWEKNLLPGTYRIVLTSHRSRGTLSVYIDLPK